MVTLVVMHLGWNDFNFDVPLAAQFGWGSLEVGRTGNAAWKYVNTTLVRVTLYL